MKILHILDHSIPLHSGYTFRTKSILDQQRKLGWETAHITSTKHNATDQQEEMVDDFRFYRTHSNRHWVQKLPVLNQLDVVSSLTARLNIVIGLEKPDILHAHSPSLNGLAALKAGRKYDIPVVYECRAFWEDAAVDHGTSREGGFRYRMTKALETYVFRRADAVTTICTGLKQDIADRGIPADKITVIPNAVDVERFSVNPPVDADLAKKLGIEGNIVLGFIGSFYAYEGLSELIRALKSIAVTVPDVRLLLVGGGPEEERLKALVTKLNLGKLVRFVGRVPHEQVSKYYSLVDILVYPRLRMRLTELVTPLKPLEAMAQRKLVLASDVGGHKELIIDGKTGVLFDAGDSESLSAAALKLLQRPEIWNGLKSQARKYVEIERNWPASVSRYREVYGKFTSQSRNSHA